MNAAELHAIYRAKRAAAREVAKRFIANQIPLDELSRANREAARARIAWLSQKELEKCQMN